MIGSCSGDIIYSGWERGRPPANYPFFTKPYTKFTDDSVCTVAVANAIITDGDFAKSFRTICRRHPDRGYGGMFKEWFMKDDAPGYGAWSNGAVMRTSPCGFLGRDEAEVIKLATEQCNVSHNDADAIEAAQAVSLAIYYLRHKRPASNIHDEFFGRVPQDPKARFNIFREDLSEVLQTTARKTAWIGLKAALGASSWEDAVRRSVAPGGDCDTLAAVAGGIAEAQFGVPPEVVAKTRTYLTEDLLEILDAAYKRAT